MEWIAKYWIEWLLGILASGMAAGYAWIRRRMKRQSMQQSAIEEGVRSLLHDRLYQAYHHYSELGYCPIRDKKNIEYLYLPYHNLGGNGTGTHMYEQIMRMPTEITPPKEGLS